MHHHEDRKSLPLLCMSMTQDDSESLAFVAEDWVYAGEGGKHAVFAYAASSFWAGRLLRVLKSDVAASQWIVNESRTTVNTKDTHLQSVSNSSSLQYIHEIILAPTNSLHNYVDLPVPVTLPVKFLNELRTRTLEMYGDCIPPRRRSDWFSNPATHAQNSYNNIVTGWVLVNYKEQWTLRIQQQQPDDDTTFQLTLAMELKPKAGYLAVSPLVSATRRCKYTQSRFQLLQQLYMHGNIDKAWQDDTAANARRRRSHYDPLQLFSMEASQMKDAIQALLECPQNNMRVWCNGRTIAIRGDNCDERQNDTATTRFQETLSEILQVSEDNACDVLVDALTAMLQQETLLPQLLRLQQLDIIDGDGAVIIFERLVNVCESEDEAIRVLDTTYQSKVFADDSKTCPPPHSLLVDSPFAAPKDTSRIYQFCELAKLILRRKATITTIELDEIHERALALVSSFDQDDCCYLLRNWLLSLAMCDVSCFITCRRSANCFHGSESRPQTKTSSGTVMVQPSTLLQYQLKVIDCDQKPASKLRNRHEKERIFDNITL